MFQVLVLICSLDLAPSQCQGDTALDVIRGPVVANEIMCGLHGQAYIAPTAIPNRGAKEYVKIACLRSRRIGEAAPASLAQQDTAR
jgi:hypothetical protein